MGLVQILGIFRHRSGEREKSRRGEPGEGHAHGLPIGVPRRGFDVVRDLLVVLAVIGFNLPTISSWLLSHRACG